MISGGKGEKNNQYTKIGCVVIQDVCNSLKSAFYFFAMFSASSYSLEEAYLNNHIINEVESLHVEMYHYVLGNRGIIVNPCSSCTK